MSTPYDRTVYERSVTRHDGAIVKQAIVDRRYFGPSGTFYRAANGSMYGAGARHVLVRTTLPDGSTRDVRCPNIREALTWSVSDGCTAEPWRRVSRHYERAAVTP